MPRNYFDEAVAARYDEGFGLGHSVETLVSTYVGALDGDDIEALRRVDAAERDTRTWMSKVAFHRDAVVTADAADQSPAS